MSWFGAFYASSIGKKILVATTGLLMLLFLVGHMLGNLQVFAGRGPTIETTKLNEYGELLRTEMGVLWAIRLGLLTILVLHVVTVVKLSAENRAARPTAYAQRTYRSASVFSRSMLWGGIALFLYVVYHLLHFTAGVVHPGLFVRGDVYGNVVRSFQQPGIAVVYVLATIALYMHLHHGAASLVQTLGVTHPRHRGTLQTAGRALSVVICLGFVSVPLGVLLRVVQ
ncbi:MAG: succinate dehydrogenase cytochrome b subunit [Candidatus Eisenbacteria bacterium]